VELLDRIDAYCDAVPRPVTRAEEFGSLVLFVREGEGWPYYARPARGGPEPTAADVRRVRERQRELGIPESFEWIADVSPAMRAAATEAGVPPNDHPLLVHRGDRGADVAPAALDVRLVGADEELAELASVAQLAFANPGTAVGEAGDADLRALVAARRPEADETLGERLRSGAAVLAVGYVDGRPVASGMHIPVGDVTEVVGVGTLPAARRRGFGAAVTAALVADARRRGVETVFLSADSDEVARLYSSLGFERIGTACIAEAATGR
jgi:ribosomal protein S18 acetylase RimI-like enzyme